MKSLISFIFIFCMTCGNGMTQENTKAEALNTSSERVINDVKPVNNCMTKSIQDEKSIADDKASSVQDDIIKPISPDRAQELWHGSIYTATYRAGVCIESNGKLYGVLKVHTAKGDVDTYHFYGNLKNNEIFAKHGSGRTFAGSLISDKKVQGKVTFKNGHTVNLMGERIKNVQLTNTCAPMPITD